MDTPKPNFSEKPDKAKTLKIIPKSAKIKNALSFGKKKKRLGKSLNLTNFKNCGTGSKPLSPKSGLNWCKATKNPIRYVKAKAF